MLLMAVGGSQEGLVVDMVASCRRGLGLIHVTDLREPTIVIY